MPWELSEDTMDAVRRANALDLELYDEARLIFFERYAEAEPFFLSGA
jgi:hypothetical protein